MTEPHTVAEAGLPTSGFIAELPLLFRGLGKRIARQLGAAPALPVATRWRGTGLATAAQHSWDAVFDLLLQDYADVASPPRDEERAPLRHAV